MNTNDLVKLLPAGYEDACYEKKAITRKRTITNPLDLLRLILFYPNLPINYTQTLVENLANPHKY